MTPITLTAITNQGLGATYVIPTLVDSIVAADATVTIGVPSGN